MDPASVQARKKILVVEDNRVARDSLVSAVTNAGFDAVPAANGADALALLRGGTPVDMIILDLVMPVMDGWEFLKAQKRDLALSSIPVLVLSGLDDLGGRASSLGVVGVLQKPVEFERLCDCIRGFAFQKRPGILIVDDEGQVRTMLGMALAHHGYSVWLASGGQEAVDFYRRHQEKVDVVLLDVFMPEFSGRETLAALKKINPDVTCCFISGDPNSNPRDALLGLGAVAVLEKPFSLVDVAHALREALGTEE
jgi:CheY-like chemotaxis protein